MNENTTPKPVLSQKPLLKSKNTGLNSSETEAFKINNALQILKVEFESKAQKQSTN